MTKLDVAWAIQELDTFLHLTAQVWPNNSGGGMVFLSTYMRGPEREASEAAYVVEKILDRLLGGPWRADRPSPDVEWAWLREQALRARTAAMREQELREKLGDGAPEMDAGKLHPWAWESGKGFWRTGHFHQAVMQAALRVNAETQAKVRRTDVSETKLFNEVFSLDPPKPNAPRLRLMLNDGSPTYTDVHRGARAFAEGLYAAIRNPGMHSVPGAGDEQLALEQLAAFSVLARWVDLAKLET